MTPAVPSFEWKSENVVGENRKIWKSTLHIYQTQQQQ